MKRVHWIIGLWLCLMLLFSTGIAQTDNLMITDGADVLEETSQFPFLAQTDELAVNVRKEISTKSEKVGRIERGTFLTVTGAEINSAGEIWYAVELKNGVKGYIRSDLLIETDEEESKQESIQGTQKKSTTKTGSGQYIGNKKTKKFHRTSCGSLPKESNRVHFSSREKAISSGYAPCKNCDP